MKRLICRVFGHRNLFRVSNCDGDRWIDMCTFCMNSSVDADPKTLESIETSATTAADMKSEEM